MRFAPIFHSFTLTFALAAMTGCPPQQRAAPMPIGPAGSGGSAGSASSTVDEMAALRDQMCACSEQSCAMAVESSYNQWRGSQTPQTVNPSEIATITELENEYHSCHGRALAGGGGQECGSQGVCGQGQECLSYYGVGGANGPTLYSCETRCDASGGCPTGMACITIPDGPGQVCRQEMAKPPTPQMPPTKVLPAQGEKCGAGDVCASGLQCIKYYGIAGPAGGQFTSCEVPCSGKGKCPSGQKCVTMADGPGQVCRPSK